MYIFTSKRISVYIAVDRTEQVYSIKVMQQ
jgi:hypothetical protein